GGGGRVVAAGGVFDRELGNNPLQADPDFAGAAPVRTIYRDLLGIEKPRRDSYRERRPETQPGRAGFSRRVPGVAATHARQTPGGRGGGRLFDRPGRNRERDARDEAPGKRRADQTRIRHHVSGDHRVVVPVYRAVRHGVGNNDGVPGAVRVAYVEHPGGRAGNRRGADHDGSRTGRGDPRADVLQLLYRARARAGDRDG